ncbi:hypothetical protein BJX63DRAFT_433540 [Aspergillus granulosus]|uniref:Uncharacterized protein n=1 Tax=Aspergillus granulosus TaxID=176169 RepID=A0ABR4H708_9EURO
MAQLRAQESELQLLPPQPNENEMPPFETDEVLSLSHETGSHPDPDRLSSSGASDAQDYVEGWPVGPRRLKNNAQSDIFSTALEVLLAGFPIAFLGLHGEEVSDYGAKVIQATNLAPSIFPIVFAAIVGNMMRSWALWKAEKCTSLGTLEQLNGSTSFAGTLSLVLALRRPGILTICILLLWAMSPLGGQSALRMISEVRSTAGGNISLAYMNMTAMSGFEGASNMDRTGPPMRAMYTTSLLASEEAKSSPRDVWGWPKIPLLRTLLPLSGSDAWRVASSENGTTTYSALTGLVLQGIPPGLDVEFPVESFYFDFDCHFVANNLTGNETLHRIGEQTLRYHNASLLFGEPSVSGRNYSNFFVETNHDLLGLGATRSQIHLFYASRDYPEWSVALFDCSLSRIPVESWIECRNALCAVTRMRPSKKDTRPPISTPFVLPPEYPGDFGPTTLINFVEYFPLAAGGMSAYQPSPTDSYIYGDPTVFALNWQRNWSTVDLQFFSNRFTTAFNTYWQTSLGPYTITSATISDPVNLTDPPGLYPRFNATPGTTSRRVTVYRTHDSWVAIFIIATALLQLCAFTGIFLRGITRAPDILGYVSSLTRGNPHVPLPAGVGDSGTTVSGLDRARLLRDMRVQIADVEGGKDVGRVAFVAVGLGGDRVGPKRLRKGRRYQ